MATGMTVGQRIASFREKAGLSCADLAAQSGVGEEVVKALEAGTVVPALGTLARISHALGLRMGTFTDDQYKPDPVITRSAEAAQPMTRPEVTTPYEYFPLAQGKSDRHMDPFRIHLTGEMAAESSAHEGEEFIICLTGEVELTYGGEKFILKAGDTAYYNSVVHHALKAVTPEGATLYGIVFIPN